MRPAQTEIQRKTKRGDADRVRREAPRGKGKKAERVEADRQKAKIYPFFLSL